jgi:hypothetical protein
VSALDVRDRRRNGLLATPTEGSRWGQDPPVTGGGTGGGESRLRRAGRLLVQPESIVSLVVVAVCTIFVFVELQPSKLLLNTTTAGGDMGAHVWLPQFVKEHLLPSLRIDGWAPDWYEGFPALTYYFPLPMFAIAIISYVIPYNIAFKLVTVAGLLTLPLACWAFGRLSRMRFPGPPCLAVGAVAYEFGREFTIYGGNIASTMAGEFSFSISLSFAVLFLGVVARGLQTGRMRAIAAVLLACTAFSHILPTFFAVGGAAVLFLQHRDLRRARWLFPVLVVGGLVTAVWSLPFEYRLPYATNMGYQKITTYLSSLFPAHDLWLFLLAAVGLCLSLARRRSMGTWLGIMLVLGAFVFRVAPQARLWNARVLPFWFLCLYLLAAVALAEVATLVVEAVGTWSATPRSLLPIPIVVLLIGLAWVGYPLRILPGGHTEAATGSYSWLGISSKDQSYLPGWVSWNYSGYQSAGKPRRDEYFALMAAMRQIGQDPSLGCGRALWQYEPELNDMGTPDALMLLPYWTNGCIGSEEGLYYESSASTPYHFLNVAELSQQPANPMAGLDYPSTYDVTEGVEHLQIEGVKYFMAETPAIEAKANADPSLTLIKKVGPYPVTYTTGTTRTVEQRTWDIYEVADTQLVTPLVNQPVVVKDLGRSETDWLAASEDWYLHPADWATYETASGPKSWARVPTGDNDLPQKPLPHVTVSAIHEGTESISFDVDRTGVPVLVKTSYFPNWAASGAGEVYRVSPNLMLVVPTSHHVTLNYGYTPVDWFGFILTLLGLAGVVELARRSAPHFAGPGHRQRVVEAHGPSWWDDHPTAPSAVVGPAPAPGSQGEEDRLADNLAEPYRRLAEEWTDLAPGAVGSGTNLDRWVGRPASVEEDEAPPLA